MYDYNKCKAFLENNFVIIGDELNINAYIYDKEEANIGEYLVDVSIQTVVDALNGVLKRSLNEKENVIFTMLLNNCDELKEGVCNCETQRNI